MLLWVPVFFWYYKYSNLFNRLLSLYPWGKAVSTRSYLPKHRTSFKQYRWPVIVLNFFSTSILKQRVGEGWRGWAERESPTLTSDLNHWALFSSHLWSTVSFRYFYKVNIPADTAYSSQEALRTYEFASALLCLFLVYLVSTLFYSSTISFWF